MVRMPFTRHLLGATVAAAFLTWGAGALAQTVALNEASIQRSKSNRPTAQQPNWISRADCLADDYISFPLTVSGYENYQLEVWVGFQSDDCTVLEARRQTTASCWKVYQGVPTQTGQTLVLSVRDIVSEDVREDGGLADGSLDSCEPKDATTAAQAIDIYFMFVDPGGGENAGGVKWATAFDLAGPTAPANASAGIGDTLIVLDWEQSTDTDGGYRFYCDPIPGKEDDQTNLTPLAGDASIDVNLDADTDATSTDAATDAEVDAEAGTDADVDAEVDAEANTDAGEAGTDADNSIESGCSASALVAGQVPDEAYYCGSGSGTSGNIKGLKNGVQYSVAVAGVDLVGNVGKLSNVTCASPSPVDDFFKVYRDAGGQAGGGFCTASGGVGHGAGVSGLLLIALAALGGTLRRRRGT